MPRDPEEFDRISRTIFRPIYPVIARHLQELSGIGGGAATDIGTGPGLLAIALAKVGDFSVFAIDTDLSMLRITRRNAQNSGCMRTVLPVGGDVHHLPLCSATIDLAVSRGSIYFWEDLTQAFREVERVLRPGGAAYLGGGFGSPELKGEIFRKMRSINPSWDEDVQRRQARASESVLKEALERAGVRNHALIKDGSGIWVEIRKI